MFRYRCTGSELEEIRDTDFLSCIEMAVVLQADVVYMQNWSHLKEVRQDDGLVYVYSKCYSSFCLYRFSLVLTKCLKICTMPISVASGRFSWMALQRTLDRRFCCPTGTSPKCIHYYETIVTIYAAVPLLRDNTRVASPKLSRQ